MITSLQEYNQSLHIINSDNKPILARLPQAEKTYQININTRTIEAPKFLGVETDNGAETLYFEVDRFVEYMDLIDTSCVITYLNANGDYRIYNVPFYDIYTRRKDNKILLPWCIGADVVKYQGIVQFTIRFFKVGKTPQGEKYLAYNLNLLPAQSEVLKGMPLPKSATDTEEIKTQSSVWYENLQAEIDELKQSKALTWTLI